MPLCLERWLAAGVLLAFSRATPIAHDRHLEHPPVYLTISSLFREGLLGSTLIDREIQIHWSPHVERISLFNTLLGNNAVPVLEINTAMYPGGFLQTNISLEDPQMPANWELSSTEEGLKGDHCLHYWVTAFSDSDHVITDCLKIRPTWMQDHKFSIGHLPLPSLFIPGTHNSACYNRGKTLSFRDTFGRYIMTQDLSVWKQLVYGVRYLDVRVGYYPISKDPCSDENFWVNHDLIKVHPLTMVLGEVKEFLKRAKDEVVILDLHRFPVGFTGRPARHRYFLSFLEHHLKDVAIPYSKDPLTLDAIWAQDKRLIIHYGEENTAKEVDWLWPPLKQVWGNKREVEDLYDFLDYWMKNKTEKKECWAAMAHLTPIPMDLLTNPQGGLREMAHPLNLNVTKWFEDKWFMSANIVATDFFMENDLIRLAVDVNIHKGDHHKSYTVDT